MDFIFIRSIFCSLLLSTALCQRRIVQGKTVNVNGTFMVYLLQAKNTKDALAGWMCAGAIVSPWFILTSSACLIDADYVYAIAGYDTYVPAQDMDDNECIKHTRKKIVSYCFTNGYSTQTNKWVYKDVALAKVEKPYDFEDPIYLKYCTYIPTQIAVGFNYFHRKVGAIATVYGWGHTKFFRPPDDTHDYNSRKLRYATTKIISKEDCKKKFAAYDMTQSIHYYSICTSGPGHLDDEGRLTPSASAEGVGCAGNDHGAPLVAWYGGRQFAVGVSMAFQVSARMECRPPFVYTSTVCLVSFLKCMLAATRRSTQECARDQNVTIEERTFEWDSIDRSTFSTFGTGSLSSGSPRRSANFASLTSNTASTA